MSTTFFSYNALLSQRASGFKNTTYALAELIDNSFDANATTISIVFLEKRVHGQRRVEEILVVDDGDGMSKSVLQGALQFGNTTNTDIAAVVKSKKKGKFGYGLPNASLSQCPSIYVYSWKKKSAVSCVYLDLELLQKTQSIDVPEVASADLPAHYHEVLGEISAHGTVVSWRQCDRLSHARGESLVKHGEKVLGRLYRHLLTQGKKINCVVFQYNPNTRKYIQESVTAIRPNDPLFLMKNTVIADALYTEAYGQGATPVIAEKYKPYVSPKRMCLATNHKLDGHCFHIDFEWRGKSFGIDGVISMADLDIQKPGVTLGGRTAVGAIYGQKEIEGNISFVRAEREIAAGHFGFYGRTDPMNRWWSMEVRFDADADDLLGVHNNKQGIEFILTNKSENNDDDAYDKHTAGLLQAREELWRDLSVKMASAIRAAMALIKKQHTKWMSTHLVAGPTDGTSIVPTGTAETQTVIKKVDGIRPRLLTPIQRKDLEDRLIEKYKGSVQPDEIRKAVDVLDRSLNRACILYIAAEAKVLWSYTKVSDILIVLVNTSHEFYSKVLAELRNDGQEGALTAVELFLSSLAFEEEELSANEQTKENIEYFRERVGLHLHRYISLLPEGTLTRAHDNDSEDA